jgi:hypothetical protein
VSAQQDSFVAVQAIPGSHPRQSPNHIPPQIPVEVKMKKTKITDDCYLGKHTHAYTRRTSEKICLKDNNQARATTGKLIQQYGLYSQGK